MRKFSLVGERSAFVARCNSRWGRICVFFSWQIIFLRWKLEHVSIVNVTILRMSARNPECDLIGSWGYFVSTASFQNIVDSFCETSLDYENVILNFYNLKSLKSLFKPQICNFRLFVRKKIFLQEKSSEYWIVNIFSSFNHISRHVLVYLVLWRHINLVDFLQALLCFAACTNMWYKGCFACRMSTASSSTALRYQNQNGEAIFLQSFVF